MAIRGGELPDSYRVVAQRLRIPIAPGCIKPSGVYGGVFVRRLSGRKVLLREAREYKTLKAGGADGTG
jgi:hypothetical protein